MKQRKPLETDEELLTVLTQLFNELDVDSDAEAAHILQEAGHTSEAVRTRARKLVNRALEESPLNWRNQKSAITKIKEQVSDVRKQYASRTEMEKKAQELFARMPRSQVVATYYRNFKEMTDEDFASWLEELAILVAHTDNDDDKQ